MSSNRLRTSALVVLLIATLVTVTTAPSYAGTRYRKIIDLTFPVAGQNHYVDSYDDCRSGCDRTHKATDIMAEFGTPVHAAMGGSVGWISTPGTSSCGYCVYINGDDGRRYAYIHLGPKKDGRENDAYVKGLERGDRLERGQLLGWVGCSGNASCSGPHLHLSIQEPGLTDPYDTNYLNPYRSLRDAEERGDLPGVFFPAARFADVPPDSSHFRNVELVAEHGITVGCKDKTIFCPDRAVTRAEMATFLARAMHLEPVLDLPFTDVPSASSHRGNIGAIYVAGITVGCKDKTVYCPDDVVTRAEMATFLARAMDLELTGPSDFVDVSPTSSHSAAIAAIRDAGITVGCGDKTTYCPDRPVTRAEMATFLARAFLGSDA